MKKTFSIFMLLLYTILTVGMSVVVHTCDGASNTILAVTEVKDPCTCGDEMPMDMCCTLEVKSVKIDDEQLSAAAPEAIKLLVVDMLPVDVFTAKLIQNPKSISVNFSDTSPPHSTDLIISNCVFLI